MLAVNNSNCESLINAHSTISTTTEQHLAVDHACSLTTHVCGEETLEKYITCNR